MFRGSTKIKTSKAGFAGTDWGKIMTLFVAVWPTESLEKSRSPSLPEKKTGTLFVCYAAERSSTAS